MNGCGIVIHVLYGMSGELEVHIYCKGKEGTPALPAPRCDGSSKTIRIQFLIDDTLSLDAKLEGRRNCREGVNGHRRLKINVEQL